MNHPTVTEPRDIRLELPAFSFIQSHVNTDIRDAVKCSNELGDQRHRYWMVGSHSVIYEIKRVVESLR
jgi:hypothetical protein